MERIEMITMKLNLNEMAFNLRVLRDKELIDEKHLETICGSLADVAQSLSELVAHIMMMAEPHWTASKPA